MSTPTSKLLVRIEYLDFKNVGDHREFRLRVHRPDGWTEVRVRIAIAAFVAGRVALQDGPDACYQKLLQAVTAGETAISDVVTMDEAELAAYREAHTPVPKRKSWAPAVTEPVQPPRQRPAPLPVAPRAAAYTDSALQEGQRVSHAVFGIGVTASSSEDHTVVRFDQDGTKTFVTSMLKLDVLSAPHTWETGPRGNNRPRKPA